jgi:hypothetical protein
VHVEVDEIHSAEKTVSEGGPISETSNHDTENIKEDKIIHTSVYRPKSCCAAEHEAARVSARRTIFRHVALNGLVSVPRMLEWIDNCLGLII